MHILNNEIRGYGRRHYGKHSGGVKKTLGTFSRARAKKGELLKAGDKEVNRKGGRFLVDFGRTISQDVLNRMSIVYRYWRRSGMMHMETRKTPRNGHE